MNQDRLSVRDGFVLRDLNFSSSLSLISCIILDQGLIALCLRLLIYEMKGFGKISDSLPKWADKSPRELCFHADSWTLFPGDSDLVGQGKYLEFCIF